MRACSGCQAEVPDESETCPRCGNLVSRGFFASLLGMFRGKPAAPDASPSPKAPPTPLRPRADGGFSMKVEDVFTITGRGTVVTGRIAGGEIKIGDEVRFTSRKGKPLQCAVVGVEMVGKIVKEAKSGDDVGLLLRGVKQQDIEIGAVIEMV